MNVVTLVNRTSKSLKGTWDGRHYDIVPGKHSFPEIQAVKFKEQNPLMGSEDYYSGEKQYLIGIEEHGDPLTPIEQSDSLTLANITEKLASGEYKIVKGNGLFSVNDKVPNPLMPHGPAEGTFVKP